MIAAEEVYRPLRRELNRLRYAHGQPSIDEVDAAIKALNQEIAVMTAAIGVQREHGRRQGIYKRRKKAASKHQKAMKLSRERAPLYEKRAELRRQREALESELRLSLGRDPGYLRMEAAYAAAQAAHAAARTTYLRLCAATEQPRKLEWLRTAGLETAPAKVWLYEDQRTREVHLFYGGQALPDGHGHGHVVLAPQGAGYRVAWHREPHGGTRHAAA